MANPSIQQPFDEMLQRVIETTRAPGSSLLHHGLAERITGGGAHDLVPRDHNGVHQAQQEITFMGGIDDQEAAAAASSASQEDEATAEAAEGNLSVNWMKMWKKSFSIARCCGGESSGLASPGPRIRVYHIWPGKNIFLFKGRLICGPDPRGLILTAFSVLLSEWIFCAYISNPSPERSTFRAKLSVILTIIVLVNLTLASTTDPGIVPRNEKSPMEAGNYYRVRSRKVVLNGAPMRIKYCGICMMFPPPRTSHCKICDNCVEKFDHHCPWISQCVGLRNYRYYLLFVFSALIFFTYILIFSCEIIRRELCMTSFGFIGLVGKNPETFLLALFSFMAVWFLGGLLIYHAYLITLNQTAHDNFKGKYSNNPNPYDKGALFNIKEALFDRLQPPKVDFRAVIEPNWRVIARMFMSSANGCSDAQVTTSRQHTDYEYKQAIVIPTEPSCH